MVYTRRSRRSRRATRPRRYRSNAGSKALAMVRSLRSKMAMEKKYYDSAFGAVVSNVGSVQGLCEIPQGDTQTSRDGGQVKFDSIFLRCQAVNAGAGLPQTLRFLLVEDKQPNAAYPVGTDVLDTFDIMSLSNIENAYRFRIWQDKRIVITPQFANDSANKVWQKWVSLRKYNKRVRYTDATDVPSSGSNFFLLMVSDQAPVSTLSVAVQARLRFFDN